MPARRHRQGGVDPHAAGLRSRRPLALRHQHRLGRPPRRGDQRAAARRVLPGQDLRAARHEGQRLSAHSAEQRAARPACTRARPTARSRPSRSRRAGPRPSSGRAAARSTPRPRDYLTFLQMLLHGGSFNGVQLLKPETVAEMHQQPHRQYPGGHAQDRDAGALERCRPLPRRADPLGTRLHAQRAAGAERPERRHGELGRDLQHLLLARPAPSASPG